MNKPFVFVGSGLGYLWLLIWTTVVSIITVGLFFPWAYSAQQRWICANTYVEGRRLRFDGTGLGLFMAKKVIAAQGGVIIFQSEEGKGSTFGFHFSKNRELPKTTVIES